MESARVVNRSTSITPSDETRPLLDCKILIDFQDSILKILPSDMTSRHTGRVIKGEARWFAHAKSLR